MRSRWLALLISLSAQLYASPGPIATILCYHEVDPATATHTRIPRLTASGSGQSEQLRYTTTPERFREQLDYLKAGGYSVIPLADLIENLHGKKSIPPRSVVITVDDGWACTRTYIAPELKRRGYPFTLFVYPSIVGNGAHALTWSEVSSLARAGVDIESHSFSHPFLSASHHPEMDSTAYEAFLRHELLDSRLRIEKSTGGRVRFLCYPFGDFDAAVERAAGNHGYAAGLTTQRGVITEETPVMELKRYLIHNDTTLDELKTFLVP